MKKQAVLKMLNPVLGILLLWQVGTGVFRELLGYEVFKVVHPLTGFLLLGLVILHIIFNWDWVKFNYFRKRKARQAAA
jgi:hypothetical protein